MKTILACAVSAYVAYIYGWTRGWDTRERDSKFEPLGFWDRFFERLAFLDPVIDGIARLLRRTL